MSILVATDREVVVIDIEEGTSALARGLGDRPTCLAADPLIRGRAWCGTHKGGMFKSDDGGRSWHSVGLPGRLIMALSASPVEQDVVWVGTEPSEVWRSGDAGITWEQTSRLETLFLIAPAAAPWNWLSPTPATSRLTTTRWRIRCKSFSAGSNAMATSVRCSRSRCSWAKRSDRGIRFSSPGRRSSNSWTSRNTDASAAHSSVRIDAALALLCEWKKPHVHGPEPRSSMRSPALCERRDSDHRGAGAVPVAG
jgi:hypothetical protein